MVWSLATVLFPATYPGLDGATYLAMAAAAAVLFFTSVLAHELGHALRAVREGERIDGVTLWLFGGVARLRGQPDSPGAEFRTAAAGPAATVVLVAVFWAVAVAAGRIGWPDGIRGLFDYLARINLLVLGFNLVPALPLDGGRVLRAWLWRRQRSFVAATRGGQAFGILLVAIGLLGLCTGGGLGGIWFACLGWLLLQAAQAEAILTLARQALGDRRVRDLMSPEPVAVAPDRTVAQFVEEAAGNRRFSSYPVVDQGRLVGMVSGRRGGGSPTGRAGASPGGRHQTGREQVPTVEGHRAAADVLAQLTGQGRRAMVVEDGRLVGVVSGAEVVRELELAQTCGLPARSGPAARAVWVVLALVLLTAGAALYRPPFVVVAPAGTAEGSGDVTITGYLG